MSYHSSLIAPILIDLEDFKVINLVLTTICFEYLLA